VFCASQACYQKFFGAFFGFDPGLALKTGVKAEAPALDGNFVSPSFDFMGCELVFRSYLSSLFGAADFI